MYGISFENKLVVAQHETYFRPFARKVQVSSAGHRGDGDVQQRNCGRPNN